MSFSLLVMLQIINLLSTFNCKFSSLFIGFVENISLSCFTDHKFCSAGPTLTVSSEALDVLFSLFFFLIHQQSFTCF